MGLSGKDDLRHLTTGLDAKKLVRLTADVLAIWGHFSIRIVDGPGDGGRDVHALAPDGGKVLAQCKFHDDPSKTCSSADVSELPMALIKLGYPRGVFVTNAGISPQAKREYLDNYPNLQLAFLDGDELVRLVLQHPILKALWFDGTALKSIAATVAVPVLIREHDADAPIVPSRWDPAPDATPLLADLSRRFPELVFGVSEAAIEAYLFEPYRYPEPLAAEEGLMPFLRATMVSVRGALQLGNVADLASGIAEAFGDFIDSKWPRFTVRVGAVRFTPLVGDQSGIAIDVPSAALSFVTTKECRCMPERSFFSIPDGDWTIHTDARVSEANCIRVFHPELDVCATYEIEGRPSAANLALLRAQNEWTTMGWEASVHALVPCYEKWEQPIPEPDEKVVWPWDGRLICAWFHGTLLSPVAVARTINEPRHPFQQFVSDRTAELELIRTHLRGMDSARVLTASEALHMLGSLGIRILLDIDRMTTRTAEASHHPEDLPSPVRPTSRRVEVLTAWKVANAQEAVELARKEAEASRETEVDFKTDGDYLVATWRVPTASLVDVSTSIMLRRVAEEQRQWLVSMEVRLAKRGLHVERETREYWHAKHNVMLGVDPYDSDKVYQWVSKDGGWLPAIAGRKFDPSAPQQPLPVGLPEEMASVLARSESPLGAEPPASAPLQHAIPLDVGVASEPSQTEELE